MLKVGDKVKIIKNYGSLLIGTVHTVYQHDDDVHGCLAIYHYCIQRSSDKSNYAELDKDIYKKIHSFKLKRKQHV